MPNMFCLQRRPCKSARYTQGIARQGRVNRSPGNTSSFLTVFSSKLVCVSNDCNAFFTIRTLLLYLLIPDNFHTNVHIFICVVHRTKHTHHYHLFVYDFVIVKLQPINIYINSIFVAPKGFTWKTCIQIHSITYENLRLTLQPINIYINSIFVAPKGFTWKTCIQIHSITYENLRLTL